MLISQLLGLTCVPPVKANNVYLTTPLTMLKYNGIRSADVWCGVTLTLGKNPRQPRLAGVSLSSLTTGPALIRILWCKSYD